MNSCTKRNRNTRTQGSLFTRCLIALALCILPSQAQDVVITSEHASQDMVSLGVLEFTPENSEARSLPVSPGRIIGFDLDFSGRFRIFDAIAYDTLTKAYFQENEVLAYLRGTYSVDGNQVKLHCELVDLETDELILGKKYSGKRGEYRELAHKFSDEMVYQLFGEKGIAQTRVVYVSKRLGNKRIYVMDYDGANVSEVSENNSINVLPNWVEGTSKVLYTSYQTGFPHFYLADLKTRANRLWLQSPGMNSSVHYNSIDNEIVYATSVEGNSEIYRRSLEEGAKGVRLTFSSAIETSPSWSPNGYEIVFISDRSGRPMLYVMDRDGSNLRRLTYEGSYNTSPAWSPQGDRIAFVGQTEGGGFDIFTTNPEGTQTVRLTGDARDNENPSWSPDGRHIIFSSTRAGPAEIYVMRSDGTGQRRLSFSGGNTAPKWSGF